MRIRRRRSRPPLTDQLTEWLLNKTVESVRWRIFVLAVATLLVAAFAVAAILTIHVNTLHSRNP